jgi:hypothetical protein
MQAWKKKIKKLKKPSLHFLLGKLEFIIKHKKMQGRRKTKCKNHQIFKAKIVASSLMPIGS